MFKDKRFEKVYAQTANTIEIWVDRETGVNYLYRSGVYGGGLAVMVDKDGKPIVTPIED